MLKRYGADVIQGLLACLAGGIVFYSLHELWYRDWISYFGEAASANYAYHGISTIFHSLPYAVGGMILGLIAGFGLHLPWKRVFVRFVSGPVLSSVVLLSKYALKEYSQTYLPTLLASFAFSVLCAWLYHSLSSNNSVPSISE